MGSLLKMPVISRVSLNRGPLNFYYGVVSVQLATGASCVFPVKELVVILVIGVGLGKQITAYVCIPRAGLGWCTPAILWGRKRPSKFTFATTRSASPAPKVIVCNALGVGVRFLTPILNLYRARSGLVYMVHVPRTVVVMREFWGG